MPKMTINEAAEYFGISKEAIHNRIRRGSLQSVVENGVKFVNIDNTLSSKNTVRKAPKKVVASATDKYYKFLEEQNDRLQNRVEVLECETRTLRDQKERMLIDERIKIEQIYKDKDEQLKNILNAISSKFMLNAPLLKEQEEHLEAEIEVDSEDVEEKVKDKIISLKKYLKQLKYSDKKVQKVKARFNKIAKKDERIIMVGKKYYLNLSKYSYEDLFG